MDFHIWKYSRSEGELFSLILASWNAAFDIHCLFSCLFNLTAVGSVTRETVLTNTKHEVYPFNTILSPQHDTVNYIYALFFGQQIARLTSLVSQKGYTYYIVAFPFCPSFQPLATATEIQSMYTSGRLNLGESFGWSWKKQLYCSARQRGSQ